MELNKYIDHTVLKAYTDENTIKKLCEEAMEHDFFAVCVNGSYVSLAKKLLADTDVKIASVIGFPLGAMEKTTKIYEAKKAIQDGADEIDMVINIGLLKSRKYKEMEEEIREIKEAIGEKTLKVILETCYLTDQEKIIACQASLSANADFVKTSTGFGTGGATLEDVKIMKEVVGDKMEIKASGGVKNKETAMKYIELGVTRIGTSSGIEIVLGKEGDPSEY